MKHGLHVSQVITGHQYPVFSVLHVANRSRQQSDYVDDDATIDGTYVISADTTDRHISVWSVNYILAMLGGGGILKTLPTVLLCTFSHM